jgi:hypothetical protein
MQPDIVQMEGRGQTSQKIVSNAAVQTSITLKDFNNNDNRLIRPTPFRLHDSLTLFPSTINQDILLIDTLSNLEHSIWDLRDTENVLPELQAFGRLNIKFELAFLKPELVSRRYPMNFKGEHILNAIKFVEGWRRHFTFYCDHAKKLPDFNRLSYVDQICIAKRRLVNIGWWNHAYYSYLISGRDGVAMSNGHYHPYKNDSRFSEVDPVMHNFAFRMMPTLMDDLITPFRRIKLDFNEFVLMKALIFFRDG